MKFNSNVPSSKEGINLQVATGNFFSKNTKNITFYSALSLLLIILLYFPSSLCHGGVMCNALENSMLWRVINLTPLIVFLFVLKEIKTWRVICEFMLLLSLFGVGGAVLAYQKIIDVNDQNFFENWHIFSIFCIAWLVIVVGFLVYQSSLNTLRRRFLIYLLILTCELYIGIAVGNMFGKELNTPGVIITTSPPPMGFI